MTERLLGTLGVSAFILLAAAFTYRPVFINHDHTCNTGYEALAVACSVAQNSEFADPFMSLATGRTAHVAPGFPAVAAKLLSWRGEEANGAHALRWAAALVLAVQLALLPMLAVHLGLRRIIGTLAAAIWLFAHFPTHYMWETSYAALLITLLAFPMYDALRGRISGPWMTASGLLWGALLLTNPAALFVLVAWLLRLRWSTREKLLWACIPLLVVAPWIARNYRVFHRPVFIRDNFGLELYLSNNACASFAFRPFEGCFERQHPNVNLAEAQAVRMAGEIEYNRARLHDALNWIGSHPERFALLSSERFLAFWFPIPEPTGPEAYTLRQTLIVDVATLLGIGGIVSLYRRSRPAAELLSLWLAVFPLVYYLMQFDARYRQPILWTSMILACYFLFDVVPDLLAGGRIIPIPIDRADVRAGQSDSGCGFSITR